MRLFSRRFLLMPAFVAAVSLAAGIALFPDGNAFIPPGHAGGPVIGGIGGNTCTRSGCHVMGDFPATDGQLVVPSTYLPGSTALQFQIQNVRGAQVTVTDAAGTRHVGTLIEGGGMLFAQNNTNYLTHDQAPSAPTTFTVSWLPPPSSEGPVRVYVAGSNGYATQTWTASALIEMASTNTPPIVTLTEVPGPVLEQRSAAFAWEGSDADGSISHYTLSLVGPTSANLTTESTTHTFDGLANGSYVFQVRAVDDEGAQSAPARHEFEVAAPNQPPVVTIVSGPSGTIATSVAAFQWTASDPDGQVVSYDVQLTGPRTSSFSSTSNFRQFESLPDGSYLFEVRARDDQDAVSDWAGRAFVVQVNPVNSPPTASFTATPGSGAEALTVHFDASASSDPDGTIQAWSWTFGDGTSGAGMTTSHTYAQAGTYLVQLTVTDNNGAGDATSQDVTVPAASVSTERGDAPGAFRIASVYPNPFNPTTTVELEVVQPGRYQIDTYDVLGRRVLTRTADADSPGVLSIRLDFDTLPGGSYIVRVRHPAGGSSRHAHVRFLK